MGDRVRVGELLAAIGSIVLAVLLAFGAWFSVDGGQVESEGTGGPAYVGVYQAGTIGSSTLGWLAIVLAGAAAASGIWFVVRSATASTTERPLLLGPVAYAWAVIALFTLLLRVVIATPDLTFDEAPATVPGVPMDVALGGWLALFATWLLVVGLWIAMSDERTQSKGARARTAALLADMTVRPAPAVLAGSHPGSDAGASADDALPTDPPDASSDSASTRPSGGPA